MRCSLRIHDTNLGKIRTVSEENTEDALETVLL